MSLLPILLTIFLDYLGFGLVFPIFFPMIMDPAGGFLAPDTSEEVRGLTIGFLISSYFIAQFFTSPMLGALSDRKGRKKILLITIAGTSIGFFIGGIGILTSSISLLFLSRIIAGAAAGNYAVAQSVISDRVDRKSKTKEFGLLNMAYGSGFVIGPFIGGQLSEFSLFGLHPYATPFWVASFLSLANFALVGWKLKESILVFKKTKLSILKGFANIQKAVTLPHLRIVFFAMFLFSFGWGFFCEFIPLFLIQKYGFGPQEIGNTYAYLGALVALCQGYLIRPVINRFSSKQALTSGLFLLGSFLPLLLLVENPWSLLWIFPPLMFFEALIYPSASTIVSDMSCPDEQGEHLGINQSVQAAAIASAPLFSGSFVAAYPFLVVVIGSVATLLAASMMLSFKSVQVQVAISKKEKEQ